MSDIDTVLERLVTDADFRRLLAAEPARALHGYDLSAQERDMLLVRVSPDTMVGSTVEQRTSKAGMFALLGEAAALVGSHSDLVGASPVDHGSATPSEPGETDGIIIYDAPTPGEAAGIIIHADEPSSPAEAAGIIIIGSAPTPGEADGIIINEAPSPGEAAGIVFWAPTPDGTDGIAGDGGYGVPDMEPDGAQHADAAVPSESELKDDPELKRQPEDSFGAAMFRAGDLAGQVSGTPPIEPEFPVR